MPPPKPLVVLGLLGSTLDAGFNDARWLRWRPTVSLFQHEDLLIHRLELVHDPSHIHLAKRVALDVQTVAPESVTHLHAIDLGDPWDFEQVYASLHDFVRAYPFDPEREEYLVHLTTGTHVSQICLFLLTEARYLPARLIQSNPPRAESEHEPRFTIVDLDLSKYDRLAARFQREHRDAASFLKSGIATRNREFNRIIDQIERVAAAGRHPILLMGPTGAGKSHLARNIYELKKARNIIPGPAVEVNCATLRGDAAMSALFGHVKGAFTGAARDRAGLLKSADRGLLFLDEIGELGLDEQAMLLRAIEQKKFFPLGSDREERSDFDLIAGTNRDLHQAVCNGAFREDLLARINLWTFRLPSLRERPEDIEPNLAFELERFASTQGNQVRFNREASDRFLAFAQSPEALWTANFRDLNASITRMATLASGGRITVALVEEEIQRLRIGWGASDRTPMSSTPLLLHLLGRSALDLDRFDQVQIEEVIRVCREAASLSEAGRRLFAISRQSKRSPNDADRLRKFLARFGLTWDQVRSASP